MAQSHVELHHNVGLVKSVGEVAAVASEKKTDNTRRRLDREATKTQEESRSRPLLKKEKSASSQSPVSWNLGSDEESFFIALGSGEQSATVASMRSQDQGLNAIASYSKQLDTINGQLQTVQGSIQAQIQQLEHPPSPSFVTTFLSLVLTIVIAVVATAVTIGTAGAGAGAEAAAGAADAAIDGAADGAGAAAEAAEGAGAGAGAAAEAGAEAGADAAGAGAAGAADGAAGLADAADAAEEAGNALGRAAENIGEDAADAAKSTFKKLLAKALTRNGALTFIGIAFASALPASIGQIGTGEQMAVQKGMSEVQDNLTQLNIQTQMLDNTGNILSSKSTSADQTLVVNAQSAETAAGQQFSQAFADFVQCFTGYQIKG